MKKSIIFFIFLWITLLVYKVIASEVKFISQPKDSLFQQTYCWQSGNRHRAILPLDGEWEYKTTEKDPYQKVILPASCDYQGEITFQKNFLPDSTFTNHFFRLICYGINYYCRIFINEKFIGSHSGGYSSFAFDIGDGVIHVNRKNIIEIKVDTRLDSKNTIPHQFQPEGIKNTAGIFRSVYLLAIPEISIEDVALDYQLVEDYSFCELEINFTLKDRIDNTPDQNSKKRRLTSLYYYIELSTKNSDRPIQHEWKEIDIQDYVLTRSISTKLKIIQPQLWSPESPALYHLRIQLFQGKQIIDQIDQSLGIKQIDFRNGNIYLNGDRIVLKGVNWAEDYLVDGAIFDPNQLVKDLEFVKQLNANAIRVLCHPAHPMLTSLCDSLGLFLLQEIPLDWAPLGRFESDIFISHYIDYFHEIINRDKAHVSVFAWGIGGHLIFHDPQSRNFVNRITKNISTFNNQYFYIWDSSPLFTVATNSTIISGISILNLKKNQIQDKLSEWLQQNNSHLTLVLSYGAPQLDVSSIGSHKALFEEYQVLQIVEAWRTITTFPEVDGYFISSLSDYQGNYPSTILRNCIDGNLRPFGLTDYNRKKRVAFEKIKSLYQESKARYNPGVDIKDELPSTFPVVGLGTILLFLFMVNSRRYFRENLKRIFIHPHGFYVDIRDGRKIPPSHTVFLAFFISIGCGLILASFLSFFKSQPHIDHLMTILLRTEDLKMRICHLSWNPVRAILFFTILSFILFLLIAFYFKFIALIARKRCSFIQSLTIPFWLGGNLIIFIPLGMILFRLVQYENLIIPILLLLLTATVWFIFRIVKGMRVIFIWTIRRAFTVLIVTIIIIFAGILYYYQSHYALIDYLKFYYQIYGTQIFTAHLH